MTFPVVDLVSVRRTVSPGSVVPTSRKPARMVITGENTDTPPIYVPFAPKEVSHSNLGGNYNQITRPALTDVISFDSPKLPSMTFSLTLADKAASASSSFAGQATTTVISIILALKKYGEQGTRVRITYGALESGLWYITSLAADSIQRDPLSDEITQAKVDLTLVRANDVEVSIGPLTGGVGPVASQPAKVITPPAQQPSSQYYTVKSGDTLWAISLKFYGVGSRWTEIADANGVTDPRLLQIDKVLRIP